jgi:plasmid replication initiation protein
LTDRKVIKHSASIQITNTVNIFQRRLWNVLLANAYYKLPEEEYFTLHLKDLKTAIDFDSNNCDYLKQSLIELIGCVVEWNVLGKDKQTDWKAFGLLASAKIEDGVLTYTYARELQQMLYNPHIYARISLSIQNKLKSKHSLALYELFLDYFISDRGFGQTPVIEIDQLRYLLGFTRNKKKPISKTNLDRYEEFKHFNNKVIKPSIEEINETTEINVRVDYKKNGRKVTGLQFFIKPQNKMLEVAVASNGSIPAKKLNNLSIAVAEIPVTQEENTIKKQIMDYGISESIAENILSQKTEKDILSDINYINKDKTNKRNLSGYAIAIFKNRKMPEEEIKKQEHKLGLLQKEDTERLDNDYELYINKEIEEYKQALEPDKLESVRRKAKEEVAEKIKTGELKIPDEKFKIYFEKRAENRICQEKIKLLSKKEFYQKSSGSYPNAVLKTE